VTLRNQVFHGLPHAKRAIHVNVGARILARRVTEGYERHLESFEDGKAGVVVFYAGEDKPIDSSSNHQIAVSLFLLISLSLGKEQDVITEFFGCTHNALLKLLEHRAEEALAVWLPGVTDQATGLRPEVSRNHIGTIAQLLNRCVDAFMHFRRDAYLVAENLGDRLVTDARLLRYILEGSFSGHVRLSDPFRRTFA